MAIIFKNDGVLSLLDMMTMGDSAKRLDPNKIGKFDSGLKYALSILYRNGITVEIFTDNIRYNFTTTIHEDPRTKKSKELMVVNESIDGADWVSHITAFSPQLGHEWKIWMAIREIYSNCLDENGDVEFETVGSCSTLDKTIIVIHDHPLLEEIKANWNNYFLPKNLIPIEKSGRITIYKNTSSHLRLYKNRILVYENIDTKSFYIYDYKEASIDEMRILNKKEEFNSAIQYAVQSSINVDFIKDYIANFGDKHYESSFSYYYSFSSTWIKIANEIYEKEGKLLTIANLHRKLTSEPGIEIGEKRLSASEPGNDWNLITVKIENVTPVQAKTFEEIVKEIAYKFNFEIKHPIRESKITGLACIADVHKKIIYVTKEFNEDTFWQLIRAHYRIDSDDSSDYVYIEHAKLLKTITSII